MATACLENLEEGLAEKRLKNFFLEGRCSLRMAVHWREGGREGERERGREGGRKEEREGGLYRAFTVIHIHK